MARVPALAEVELAPRRTAGHSACRRSCIAPAPGSLSMVEVCRRTFACRCIPASISRAVAMARSNAHQSTRRALTATGGRKIPCVIGADNRAKRRSHWRAWTYRDESLMGLRYVRAPCGPSVADDILRSRLGAA